MQWHPLHHLSVITALCGGAIGTVTQAATREPLPRSTPVSVEISRVAGLNQEASILIDRWGVPHIYAASPDDVFFVQGYNAARDRLFQIDLWRRRGLGCIPSRSGMLPTAASSSLPEPAKSASLVRCRLA